MMMRLKCACGWEAKGTEDEVVVATQQHAEQLHNMRATREDVLTRMEPVPEILTDQGGQGTIRG